MASKITLDDLLSLAEAAEDLGTDPSWLRAEAAAGRFEAKLVGKTWVTTIQARDRYRAERAGRVGRPRKVETLGPRTLEQDIAAGQAIAQGRPSNPPD